MIRVMNLLLSGLSMAVIVFSHACKSQPSTSTVSNNGSVVENPQQSSTVMLKTSEGICSGSVVNQVPHILTAAHCVTKKADPATETQALLGSQILVEKAVALPARQIKVQISGRWVAAIKVDVNPSYLQSPSSTNDLAVVTVKLPDGVALPEPRKLTESGPEVGDKVAISGFGHSDPILFADDDQDDYQNADDLCPKTPADQKADVSSAADRMGCAPGETPDTEWQQRMTALQKGAGVLREGHNSVDSVAEGNITTCGPPKANPGPNQVSALPGDSGGPLLDSQGHVIGVVSCGGTTADGQLDSTFVDLSNKDSRRFIDSILSPP